MRLVVYITAVLAICAAALRGVLRAGRDARLGGGGRRGEPAAAATPVSSADWSIVAVMLALAVAVAAARMFLDRYLVYDDAFMSYRYARHLAFGHGLVWNPGEAPVEGYTNFLLVVLLAPFIRLGLDPLDVTRVLSALAAAGLSALVLERARRQTSLPVAVAVTATFVASHGTLFALTMVGLETVLFTSALFLAFHYGSDYLEQRHEHLLRRAAFALLASALLRPEGVFLAGILTAVALTPSLTSGQRPDRRAIGVAALCFVLPLGAYVIWKAIYFGGVVPNPTYVKLPSGGLLVQSGLSSVNSFLSGNWKLLLLALWSVVLGGATSGRLVAALLVLGYCAFYLRVDTLMNIHNRFLFPMTPFLFELALPAVRKAHEAWLARRETPVLKATCVLVTFFLLAFPYPESTLTELKLAAKRGYTFAPDPKEAVEGYGHSRHVRDVSKVLGTFPGIERLTIASVDAGVIAYYSGARHVDTVGLNDRAIAREHDVSRLTAYFFGRKPDLIFQRERVGGALITYGHGTLGNHALWAHHPGWDDYTYVGTVIDVEPWRHELHIYARKGGLQARTLAEFVSRRVVDFVHPVPPVKLGSAAPPPRP